MKAVNDLVKLFGMSNQLLTNDLDRIERDFGISLEHRTVTTRNRDAEYFPQFDEKVRKTAKEMSAHYEVFYCLEVSLRSLISEVLFEKAGGNWWENEDIIPPAIKAGAINRISDQRQLFLPINDN